MSNQTSLRGQLLALIGGESIPLCSFRLTPGYLGPAEKAAQPLPDGPFKPLLFALQRLQHAGTPAMRIRTALVTARSAPAHERAIRTLMNWNIEVDEAMFLGGLAKGEFLREFEPDFFFDDQTGHIESAAQHVPSGHVASGIRNSPS